MVGVRSHGQTSFKCNQICGGAKLQRGIGPPYRSGGSAGLAALHLLQARATAEATATAGIPWDGGALWVCGDAVNPSMGAWSRHPCRSHPANPQYPAFDSRPVASRSTPCVDESPLKSSISTIERRASTHGVDLLQIAENCRRRGGSGGRGVSRMDAATELTWTYLQRPLPPDPPRLPTGIRPLPLLQPLRVQGAALQRAPYLNRPFCARSQPSVRLGRSAAAVRFPPGPPATRVRPVRPPPLRRRSSRIPAGASCRLHPTSRSAVHGNAPSQPITLICPRLSVRTGVSCTWSNLNVF